VLKSAVSAGYAYPQKRPRNTQGQLPSDQMDQFRMPLNIPETEISVVIPHLNQPTFLKRCLASLAAQTLQPTEIIVVDNGSSELPTDICKLFPNVVLLQEPAPGPGPARNLGISKARSNILAFIDADCLASPQWLEVVAREIHKDGPVILGGDVRIAYVNPDRLTPLEAYESIYAYRMERYIKREGFTGTGNLVVKKEVLEHVGSFAGIEVAEDRDWGQRATALGYKIHYVADMKVYHPARKRFSELTLKWDRHMAHDFACVSGALGWAKWLTKTVAMCASPFFEIPRVVTSNRLSGASNRVKAFMVLLQIRLYRAKRMLQLTAGMNPARLFQDWNKKT
jgi:glycosyltransferase involved in cell wall biosynthesis